MTKTEDMAVPEMVSRLGLLFANHAHGFLVNAAAPADAGFSWGEFSAREKALSLAFARAAIEAMMEPGFDVLDAGVCHEITAFREEENQGITILRNAHVGGPSINGLWQAMLRASLQIKGEE